MEVDSEFIDSTAEQRADDIREFDGMSKIALGQMLEIAFQKKDYQVMGYNDFKDYISGEFDFSARTASSRRELYLSSISGSGAKVALGCKTNLKEDEDMGDIEFKDVLGGNTTSWKKEDKIATAHRVVDKANGSSDEIKKAVCDKGQSIESIETVLDSDLSDEDKVKAIRNKSEFEKVFKSNKTKVEAETKLKDANKKIKELQKQVDELKGELEVEKELRKILTKASTAKFVEQILRRISKNEFEFRKLRNSPELIDAFNVFGEGVITDADKLKKLYREKAKQHHPDKGGDENMFKQIASANSRIKKYIEGL